MEIANGYDVDNSLDPINSSFHSVLKNQNRNLNSNMSSSKSTFYASESKDKNNNYNNNLENKQQLNKSASQPKIHKPSDPNHSYNDFDFGKAIKKLEKENKNSKDFAMNLIAMQSTSHNVDLVIQAYIDKVVLFRLWAKKFTLKRRKYFSF